MLEIIQNNILEIIFAVIAAVVTYIGNTIKKKIAERLNEEEIQKVVKTCVNAVEQLYGDLSGAEKLVKAKENIIEILKSKGLSITDLELSMMIECAVKVLKEKKGDEEYLTCIGK